MCREIIFDELFIPSKVTPNTFSRLFLFQRAPLLLKSNNDLVISRLKDSLAPTIGINTTHEDQIILEHSPLQVEQSINMMT